MNLFAISGLLIGVPCFILGLLTLFRAKKSLHYIWALFSFSVALWGFGGFRIATITDPQKAIFWWKVSYIGVIFIPILLTHFIHKLLDISRKQLIWMIYSLGFLFLLANLFTDFFIDQVRFVFGQFYYLSPPTSLYSLFLIFFISLVIYCHILLWLAFKKSKGVGKDQIKYILVATVIGFSGGFFAFLPVYKFDLYPFLNITISFSPFIVAYAIFRYRLMDIRIVARRIFTYFGVALFTYGAFYFIVWSYEEMFGGVFNQTSYLAGIIIAPLFVVAFYQLGKLLKNFSNKYFFTSLYNYQETINKLTKELNYYTDLDKIIDSIVGSIKETMNLNRTGVLLVNSDKKPVHYQIAKVIGFNEQNGISLVQDNFLTQYLQKNQKPMVRDELFLIARDAKIKKDQMGFKNLYNHMEHIEASLCLPLLSNNKLIGIIVLGAKISGDAYTKEDLELLSTLSYQAGIAIDNAKLYKEVQDFNKTLKQKVDGQTKEIKSQSKDIEEKNKYLQELLNMKTDFLRVVNHQLNTPLSVMKGYFSMLEEDSYPKEKAIKSIKGGLERISSTVSDFWDAYELEGERMEMDPQKTDITEIVNRLIPEKQKLQLAQERNLEVSVKKPDFSTKGGSASGGNIPLVWCDYKKTAHVISNLLDNAVYYTRKGAVTLSYEMVGKDYLKINIKDTGVGISEEGKKKLFQKFSRGQNATDLRPDGSGLGLFIAKKIVEGNNGEISCFSEGIGKGSTFSFTLPVYKNQQTATGQEKPVTREKKIVIFNQD